jgi:hypothetical protein
MPRDSFILEYARGRSAGIEKKARPMILVDTGPLLALFDPKDGQHARCVGVLRSIREPLCATVAVLTEAFHILEPQSVGSDRLREFIAKGAMSVWFFLPLKPWRRAKYLRSTEMTLRLTGYVAGIGTTLLKYWDEPMLGPKSKPHTCDNLHYNIVITS